MTGTPPAAQTDRPIRGFDTFLAVLSALGVTFIAGGAIGVIIGIFWAAQKRPGNPALFLQTDFNAVVGLTTGLNAVILVLLYAVAKRFTRRPAAYFFPNVSRTTFALAALSALVLAAASLGLEAALQSGWNITIAPSQSETAMSPTSWTQLAIVLVFFAVFVPLYEEVLFRGFIFGWLKQTVPAGLAMVLSAAIFALVHGLFLTRGTISGWVGTGEIFVLGCVMAWWVKRTGSLWPGYIVHAVNNALAFTLSFLWPNLP